MTIAATAQVHATAIISSEATLGDHVIVGPYVVIEGQVSIGPNCRIDPHVHLIGPLKMGQGNRVGTCTVIGSEPQHLSYAGQPSQTEIGEFNTFREHVTVHRGSHVEGYGTTRIGNHNYFMATSHVGHDSVVGDHCILANCALMGGHGVLQDRVFMSGNTSLHQFTRMGRLSLLMGQEGVGKDVPPFLTAKNPHAILGINLVGLRRAGYSTAEIVDIRRACHILYRSDLLLKQGVDRLEEELGSRPLIQEMLRFIRESKRGVIRSMERSTSDSGD